VPETVGPLWSWLLLVVVLVGYAYLAATFDAVMAARASGRTVGWTTLLRPMRKTVRLLATQRTSVTLPDANSWRFGTAMLVFVPVAASVVIPLSSTLIVSDLLVGAIWWYALHTLLWVAVHEVGWSSNSHYPLIGAYRYLGQAFSYTMALSILLLVVAVPAASFRISEIVATQDPLWYVAWAPLAAVLHLAFTLALAFYGPFETPTANDLAGGVAVELSSVDRLLFFVGRYLALVSGAALAVPLYLGGHQGPWLPGWLWIAVKTVAVIVILVSAKWLLPRIPVDRFGQIAWIVLIPAALVQLFVTAGVALAVR
jgi:NADH-quinone oxidoreductase subunit H